ncbi:MAG: HD-GYP domain-containing protein [Planctomycetes bacterium]|nr:HD-GYP domain-containing protein [Planctomycetota bacterium]MBI3832773.1 HD-GYP domain-containing protein [Planctomycetota bacterium]
MTGAPHNQEPMDPDGTNSDALDCLSDLRQAINLTQSPAAADNMLGRMSRSIDQVIHEHKTMADELLSVYEQLGIVFDLTRKLVSFASEGEMIDFFASSLRRSFMDRLVLVAFPHGDGRDPRADTSNWQIDGVPPETKAWLGGLLDRACRYHDVLVESPRSDANPPKIAEALAGPVMSGTNLVCVIVLTRDSSTAAFRASEMQLIGSLNRFCGDLIQSRRLVHELRGMSVAMVRALVSAVDQKDEYTCGHSLRVAYFTTNLGKALGISGVDLQMLQWAALLHDVGKIGIRDSVLKKEGKLTNEEMLHIREHPIRSHLVVQEVPQLAAALKGILHHHERYDGSGYPDGLKGEQIPLQARIIQIADVFDALTSTRSYRPAYSFQRALAIMREEAGRTIDPILEARFEEWIQQELLGDERQWERLVQRANEFAREVEHTA